MPMTGLLMRGNQSREREFRHLSVVSLMPFLEHLSSPWTTPVLCDYGFCLCLYLYHLLLFLLNKQTKTSSLWASSPWSPSSSMHKNLIMGHHYDPVTLRSPTFTGSAPSWPTEQSANRHTAQRYSLILHDVVTCFQPTFWSCTMLFRPLCLCKAIPSAWVVFPPSHQWEGVGCSPGLTCASIAQLRIGPGTKQMPLRTYREEMFSSFCWSWSKSFIITTIII